MWQNLKRIGIDILGYALILGGIAFGWLPGPGGVPLVLAGLGLLSIHNDWAKRLRIRLEQHGGRLVKVAFPKDPLVQIIYDIISVIFFIVATVLIIKQTAIWQITIAVALFFLSVTIVSMNRGRLGGLRRTDK